jgi:sugar-specific transcriptional regulator TrmB
MYFKPAKPLIFIVYENQSGIVLGKYIWQENIYSDLNQDLVDMIGGAFTSISSIIEEIFKESGHLRILQKDNYQIMFEYHENITGILFTDNNSIDLRRRLRDATDEFFEEYKEILQNNAQNGRMVSDIDVSHIAQIIFKQSAKNGSYEQDMIEHSDEI